MTSYIRHTTETRSNGLEQEFEITIAHTFIDEKIQQALKAKAAAVSLPGFRPGKAPLSLIEQRYGQEIINDTLSDVLGYVSEEFLSQRKIRTAAAPHYHIEKDYEAGKDFSYRLHFEIMPEIDLVDVKSLEFADYKIKITADDIAGLNKIRARALAKKEPYAINHKSQLGDIATIDFEGSLKGVVLPEATAKNYDLELGSNTFIPGFEEGLLNQLAGAEVTLKLTFPENYHSAKLAGQLVQFKVKINEISQRIAPEMDEELAKKLGFKNLEEIEVENTRIVENSHKEVVAETMKQQVLDALDKKYSFAVPPRMARLEFEGMCRQLEAGLPQAEQEKHRKNKYADWKDEYQPIADRRVRLGLVLAELANHHKIQVDNRDLSGAILKEAQAYPGEEKKVIDFYKSNQNALAYLRAALLEDKVIDFILKNAKLTLKEVTKEELQKIREDSQDHSSKEKKKKK